MTKNIKLTKLQRTHLKKYILQCMLVRHTLIESVEYIKRILGIEYSPTTLTHIIGMIRKNAAEDYLMGSKILTLILTKLSTTWDYPRVLGARPNRIYLHPGQDNPIRFPDTIGFSLKYQAGQTYEYGMILGIDRIDILED